MDLENVLDRKPMKASGLSKMRPERQLETQIVKHESFLAQTLKLPIKSELFPLNQSGPWANAVLQARCHSVQQAAHEPAPTLIINMFHYTATEQMRS